GHDIMGPCLRVWDAAVEKAYGGKRKIHWARLYLGEEASEKYDGSYFPEETLEAIKELIVAIKGPLTTPVGGGVRSLSGALRQALGLYAWGRPGRHYRGRPPPLKSRADVAVVVFREHTGDVCSGSAFRWDSGEAEWRANSPREETGANFFDHAGLGVKPM